MYENLNIAGIDTKSPVVLAPIAGYTDFAFRKAIRQSGFPGLCVTELLSCRSIHQHRDRKLTKLLVTDETENPLSWQLFGYEPEYMAYSAKWLEKNRDSIIIDINMGCSARKVLKKGAGSGLLKDLKLAEANLKAVVEVVSIPVTVKIRLSWGDDPSWLREAVLLFQEAGAKMICLHARKPQEAFKGDAKWDRIAEIVEILDIPVVGNGSIWTVEDGLRMKKETGCHGVMVGRGCLKDPFLPRDLHLALKGLPPAQDNDLLSFMKQHIKNLPKIHGNMHSLVVFRKWRGKYPKLIWDRQEEIFDALFKKKDVD